VDFEDQDGPAEGPNIGLFLAVVLGAVVVGGVTDLILDAPTRPSAHVVLEILLILLSLGGLGYLARGWMAARHSLESAHRDLATRRAERDAWRASAERALDGLGREVARQFDAWELSPAERELALRLIKGHSVKRIAREIDRSEKTVRQHAVAVYRKSGLSGRAELAGFFLGGLLLPAREGEPEVEPR